MISAIFAFFFITTAAMARELPADLAKVYSYQCEATFLEGEGIKSDELSCASFQQLGLLTARYHHYFFQSGAASNAAKRSGDTFYADTVCNLELLRTRCAEKAAQLAFALASTADQTFSVPVKLSPAPGLAPELQGYAAPSTKGKCAEGLQLVQAYRAVPKSIHSPLPTNFINANGSVDDILILPPQKKTPRFEVNRQRNNEACDDSGDCSQARFDQAVGIQRVDYKAGAAVCVVPKAALGNVSETFP